ncbi:MAG: type III-B CRISPR module RAMP protein Cmr4 [Chitinophagales bacterium]
MYQIAKPLFLICETPMHAGSGSDLGIVDLPIQRERHTDFPKIEGSSLKGALREAVEQKVASKNFNGFIDDDVKIHRVFGYDDGSLSKKQVENLKNALKDKEGKEQKDFAGAIGFTDARLLLFPVKSMKGVFAWITCKKVLKQFESDMKLAKIDRLPAIPPENKIAEGSSLLISKSKQKVVLEEYTFKVEKDPKVNDLGNWLAKHLFNNDGSYWSEKVKKDIIVLPDDDFKDFVNLSTEVITRTKISNETGTVESGALFTEEYLPSESVMYALVLAHQEFRAGSTFDADEVLGFFDTHLNEVVQIGGSATIGKGLVRTAFFN